MRRGFHWLSAQVQTVLEQQPLAGHVFVFRGRRGDIVQVLWFDGDGSCQLAKRLGRGRFVWPHATSGTASLSRAQLSMLLEGIDWRAPIRHRGCDPLHALALACHNPLRRRRHS
jgi:transposase